MLLFYNFNEVHELVIKLNYYENKNIIQFSKYKLHLLHNTILCQVYSIQSSMETCLLFFIFQNITSHLAKC